MHESCVRCFVYSSLNGFFMPHIFMISHTFFLFLLVSHILPAQYSSHLAVKTRFSYDWACEFLLDDILYFCYFVRNLINCLFPALLSLFIGFILPCSTTNIEATTTWARVYEWKLWTPLNEKTWSAFDIFSIPFSARIAFYSQSTTHKYIPVYTRTQIPKQEKRRKNGTKTFIPATIITLNFCMQTMKIYSS